MSDYLVMDSWAGRLKQPVEVIAVLGRRTIIRAITRTRLGGANRFIDPGQEATVPTYAVLRNGAYHAEAD